MSSHMDALTFDEATHTYRYAGVIVPSVTQILSAVKSFDGIPADVLERASQRGTAVHLACELNDKGILDEESVDEVVAPYLAAWRAFRKEEGGEIELIEQRVYHKRYRYAGTYDRRMKVRGRRAMLDIKTSVQMHPSIGLQLAAYEAADDAELDGDLLDRYGLQLRKDGTYRLIPYTERGDFATFLSLINIHNWKVKHGTQD